MEDIETLDTTPQSETAEHEDTSVDTDDTTEQKEEAKPEPQPEEDEAAKRQARMAHEAREAKKLVRQLQAELDAIKGNRPPEQPDAELERKIEQRAAQKAREQAFADMCNDVYHKGVKEFGKSEWDDAIKALTDHTGTVIPPVIVEAAHDAGDAHKILKYLYDNPDVYDDVLNMPIHRMGAKIGKIANKLEAQAAKQVSKAPPPPKTVSGTSKSEPSLDEMSMDEYVKYRDKQEWKAKGWIR
jgi:hypothetical protein